MAVNGAYILKNVTKDLFYIGSSADIEKRIKRHIDELNRKKTPQCDFPTRVLDWR